MTLLKMYAEICLFEVHNNKRKTNQIFFFCIFRFIRTAGAGNSFYFYVVEAIFIAVFIIVRGMLGTYVLVHVLLNSNVDIENKIQAMLMHAISLAFIFNILKYIRNKYIKKMGRQVVSITRVTTYGIPPNAPSPPPPPPPPTSVPGLR